MAELGGFFAAGRGANPQGQRPPDTGDRRPGQGGARQGGGFNIQEMLERLPTISVNDLKAGDTIVVSSTKGADDARLTAITLVSGADTLLNMLAARQAQQPGQAVPNPAAGLGSGGFQIGIGLP
jgi:hypothetical protein